MAARDHKHDLAFRPLETALEKGTVDAIYTQSKAFQHLQEDDRQVQGDRGPVPLPGLDAADGQLPRRHHLHRRRWPSEHPELVIAFMKAMIKVGRWANEHKHAAAVILDRQTFYRDVEDTYQGIKDIDMVPNLSPQNLAAVEIGKDFMLSHGYIKRDFDVHEWAAPQFLEKAAEAAAGRGVEADHHRQVCPRPPSWSSAIARLG